MKREDLDAFIADVLGEHLEKFREQLQAMVRAIPLPPFAPPQPWDSRGVLYPAGLVVRHRNGLFSSRRDTTDEPPSDAWLPLLVGVAGVTVSWPTDRKMLLAIELSDGSKVETERDFDIPLARGFWKPDQLYRVGDRVLRFGDWQAIKDSMGIDPNAPDGGDHWVKVSGKQARGVSFKLDDEGRLYEGGHEIGTIKPVVADLLEKLLPSKAAQP